MSIEQDTIQDSDLPPPSPPSSGSWTASRPPTEREYERRWWTLGVLCISLVMIVMANASLNVALPTLAESLHTGAERPAVDRRRVLAGVRRPAADRRFAR